MTFPALFRWSHYIPGARAAETGDGQLIAPVQQATWGQLPTIFAFACGHVAHVSLSTGNNAMGHPKWASWGQEVTDLSMQCHHYSC